MKKTGKKTDPLRKRAEELLKKQTGRIDNLSATDMKTLIHELGTHQIELEMQNEELRLSQVELDTSRRKYADLYDFAPVGYFTFDAQGLILEANRTGAEMLGVSKRLLVNKPFSYFVKSAEERGAFHSHLGETLRGQTKKTCELRIKGKDGKEFTAALQSVPAEDSLGAALVRTALTDISERKLAEDALQKVHMELEQRAYELEAVNRELDAFAHTVSHDLKAPLRSIDGFAKALSEDYRDKLDATGKDYLARVNAAALRMNQLIEAMLNMARLTRGELHEKTVDLSSLVHGVAHNLRKRNPERRVEFIIAAKINAHADQDMLTIVLQNLLDNAWKFTSRRPAARIEFGTSDRDGRAVYFVKDDGAGFDMQFADKLFMPFKRMHSESEFPGLGIGLAIAYRIILRHGGRMWAESRPEKETTFFFTLDR